MAGWRKKFCAGTIILIGYLTITAMFSINQIQSKLPKTTVVRIKRVQQSLRNRDGVHQPRNLAAYSNNSPINRITPRRLRSRMGPTIDWCVPLRYRNSPGQTVALASFPGSGNTWLRYLIQQTTGIYFPLNIIFCMSHLSLSADTST